MPRATYLSVCAFIMGYCLGGEHESLVGFHDWMAERLGTRPELAWSSQVLAELYSPEQIPSAQAFTEEQDKEAITALFDLLETYFASVSTTS